MVESVGNHAVYGKKVNTLNLISSYITYISHALRQQPKWVEVGELKAYIFLSLQTSQKPQVLVNCTYSMISTKAVV